MKSFDSFGKMALAMNEAATKEVVALHQGLESVAAHVEKEAKKEIGHYQDAIGPYPAWAELAESTKADRLSQGYTENDPGFRSGKMQRSIENRVEPGEAVIGSNDQDLVWFELGTDKQEPRPVLGTAAEKSHEHIRKVLGGAAIAGVLGQTSIPAIFEYDHDI